MTNYSTILRNNGYPELRLNSIKEMRGSMGQSPNQVKKPQKAEVNFWPDYPAGQTRESMVMGRQALTLEVKKKKQPSAYRLEDAKKPLFTGDMRLLKICP